MSEGKSTDVDEVSLPKVEFKVPRWLVTHWRFKRTTCDSKVTYSDPEPWKWGSFTLPPDYPNSNEVAFLLKLGIEQESDRQTRDLMGYICSRDRSAFRARFMDLKRKNTDKRGKRFVVYVFASVEELAHEKNIAMPPPGARVSIKLHRDGHHPTDLSGMVVTDPLDSKASFVCVCSVQPGKSLAGIEEGTDHNIGLGYVIDNLPHQRQMQAIKRLQETKTIDHGPDVKRLVLGGPGVAKKSSFAADNISEQRLDAFTAFIAAFGLSEEQELAATHTCGSQSGFTFVQGPPGTGKTALLKGVTLAHRSIRGRCLLAAPQNAAVYTLVHALARDLNDEEWVMFTSAHMHVQSAEALRLRQLDGGEEYVKAENDLYKYLESANAQHPSPEYRWTLGYKLKAFIPL